MEQVGARPRSPLTLLREYTVALRALLNGERVTTAGDYVRLDDVALDWPPDPPPPLMLGGEGPKSVALAAELGDGTLLVRGAERRRDPRASSTPCGEVKGRAPTLVAAHIVATGPNADERLADELPTWGKSARDGNRRRRATPPRSPPPIRHLADLGCTNVAIQPTEDEPDLDGLIRFLGDGGRPARRTCLDRR